MTSARAPQFALSRRGYDPAEVDDYVAATEAALAEAHARTRSCETTIDSLRREVAELRNRAARAEPDDDAAPRSIAALGDRVAAILQAAADAGSVLEAEAGRALEEARSVRASAEADASTRADEVFARAKVEAQRRVDEGEAAAERLLADARAEAQRVGVEAGEAAASRASVLDDLRRLRRSLEEVLVRLPSDEPALDLRDG